MKVLDGISVRYKPPYFEHNIVNTTVIQCQKAKNDFWNFELPFIIDPRNSHVSLTVKLDNDFFVHDEKLREIRQIQILKNSVN